MGFTLLLEVLLPWELEHLQLSPVALGSKILPPRWQEHKHSSPQGMLLQSKAGQVTL